MALTKLALPPDQDGYTVQWGQDFIATKLDGGASRFRADQLGSVFTVGVQWSLTFRAYTYLLAFYRMILGYGATPFLLDMIIDSGDMQEYVVHLLPNTFKLSKQEGYRYIVTATLEVVPNVAYAVNDAAILAAGPQ